MSGITHNTSAAELEREAARRHGTLYQAANPIEHVKHRNLAAPSPEKTRAATEADIELLRDRLNEAEHTAGNLQFQVSWTVGNGAPMRPDSQRAIALREARDQVKQLRMALDEAIAALDRERLATIPDRFTECAKTFGAETGTNGWASCSDLPAEALAACLDPMIVAVAAHEVSASRIFNQIRNTVERAVPTACFPFMPRELFDTSSPVRSVIIERIRQRVKGAEDHPHSQ